MSGPRRLRFAGSLHDNLRPPELLELAEARASEDPAGLAVRAIAQALDEELGESYEAVRGAGALAFWLLKAVALDSVGRQGERLVMMDRGTVIDLAMALLCTRAVRAAMAYEEACGLDWSPDAAREPG